MLQEEVLSIVIMKSNDQRHLSVLAWRNGVLPEPQWVFPQKQQGLTLDQYFKGGNFQVVEINEEDYDNEQALRIPPLANFRIKTGKKRQETLSNKKLQQFQQVISPAPQRRPVIKQTTNDFFRQEDVFRRTNMEIKYGRQRDLKFNNPDAELYSKYADKFQIYDPNPQPKLPKFNLAPKEIYAKLK